MLKTNSILRATERNAGPKSGKKQPLRILEPEMATRQAPPATSYAGLEKT
jgi:hypothetical protein